MDPFQFNGSLIKVKSPVEINWNIIDMDLWLQSLYDSCSSQNTKMWEKNELKKNLEHKMTI